MERREEVPYARPAGRQANATQEAFARARSVWPRLDSTTGPSRGRTSSPDLARGSPKPTCAGPPGRARACRVLCGLTLASSLFLFFLTAYFLSLTLSLRPFPHPSRSVHFPPSLSLLHSFFFLAPRVVPFFFLSFVSFHALFFFLFFYGFTAFFSFSPFVSSLFPPWNSCMFHCENFLFIFTLLPSQLLRCSRHVTYSTLLSLSLDCGCSPPSPLPLLFCLSLLHTVSLDSVRAAKMRWPRRRTSEESGGADSGVSNEGSCRSRDIAADRTAKWNSN